MINIFSSSRYLINRKKIRERVSELLAQNHIVSSETINIVFLGKSKMRELSKKYKNEDVALPVLAFPTASVEVDLPLGEICICYPQAVLLAAEREKTVDHTILQLIEHGLKNVLP